MSATSDMDHKAHTNDSDFEKSDLEKSMTNPNPHDIVYDGTVANADYEGKPTPEEMDTLRRVAGPMPKTAYLICIVEFCERKSSFWAYHVFCFRLRIVSIG